MHARSVFGDTAKRIYILSISHVAEMFALPDEKNKVVLPSARPERAKKHKTLVRYATEYVHSLSASILSLSVLGIDCDPCRDTQAFPFSRFLHGCVWRCLTCIH